MSFDDTLYINIAQFLISVMLAIVFGLSWKSIEKHKHILCWSLLFALAAVNGLFNAFSRSIFPNKELYWIVVNVMSLSIAWLAWAGFRFRNNQSLRSLSMSLLLAIALGLVFLFTVIKPHIGLQMVVIPYASAFIMLACIKEISSSGHRLSAAEKATIAVFLIYALAQLAAGTAAVMQGAEVNDDYLNMYLKLNLLLMPAAFTGLGLFTLLIVVNDMGGRLRTLASTDQLTGVYNRRGFYDRADQILGNINLKDTSVCLVAADLDHFKNVNDTFGHQMGDIALKRFTSLLPQFLRGSDLIGRMGGEEFAVILPDVTMEQAENVIERLRQTLEEQVIAIGNMKCKITASFGISQIDQENKPIEKAMRRADRALYEAKEKGRNCVVVYS